MKQDIINKIYQYFKVWWIPILSYLVPFGIFVLGDILKSDTIVDISLILFFLNLFGNIISAIVQIIIKKWYYLIPQALISVLFFFYLSIVFTFSPPDYYGANKEIPKGIEIYKPIENQPTKQELEKYDLILGSSIQPGIYNYYTDYQTTELGEFYIKAFEITSKDKLSEGRLKHRSKIKVENLESKLYWGEFTIYEGSWGDKYGAKFELWFEPTNGMKAYKICERNYIIEGWER